MLRACRLGKSIREKEVTNPFVVLQWLTSFCFCGLPPSQPNLPSSPLRAARGASGNEGDGQTCHFREDKAKTLGADFLKWLLITAAKLMFPVKCAFLAFCLSPVTTLTLHPSPVSPICSTFLAPILNQQNTAWHLSDGASNRRRQQVPSRRLPSAAGPHGASS